ncbi:MAG TPA: hypothetical protein VHW23_22275 [Kofleriaceae bacterium]|jgi:hypothetical protein|nr:hypothetical protein [Kofleriaceae bacterium]
MMRAALVLVALSTLLGACGTEKETPEKAAERAECRKLMAHIFQITPRPGGGAPETDPARIQALVAAVPVEDIEQCGAVKDAVKPGEPPRPEHQTPKVIACMQAANDVAALRACIPAQAE